MSPEQLRELCYAIRRGERSCDEGLVAAIESDIDQYRLAEVEQLPPDHLVERLPLMGWLIYEASWSTVQLIRDRRSREQSATLAADANRDLIARLADAARHMVWPEWAVRALGAIRAQALAESKRDSEDGYVRAQMTHQEARNRHSSFLTYHLERHADPKGKDLRTLDEMLVQLVLSETGTACRTAEQVMGQWDGRVAGMDPAAAEQQGEEWAQKLFEQLRNGVDIGEQALQAADRVYQHHKFVDEVSEEGLALPTSFVNPGIMAARALLLTMALYPEMERLGRYPLGDDDSWDESRQHLAERFESIYEYIERPVLNSQGDPLPLKIDFQIQIVQIRLNAALLMPGRVLRSQHRYAACLEHEILDDDAVEAMCHWLAAQRSVHRGIGSTTMPRVIDAIEHCRVAFGGRPGYRDWRARWFVLDAYADEAGRAERVSALLGRQVARPT